MIITSEIYININKIIIKQGVTDSQRYPLNLYLIIYVDDIGVFIALKLLKLIIFSSQQKKCACSFSTETTLENNKIFEQLNIDIVFFLEQT